LPSTRAIVPSGFCPNTTRSKAGKTGFLKEEEKKKTLFTNPPLNALVLKIDKGKSE
jgi:hypothetical protein